MPRRKNKVSKVAIHGDATHNAAFLMAIGGLIVNWANNESVFLAMLQTLLLGGRLSAAIVWSSHRTSAVKLELVHRLCRERVTDQTLLQDLTSAIEQFKGFSRTRNFFCHATYHYDKELHLLSATGTSSPPDGEPFLNVVKRMDKATLNEINNTSVELGNFNSTLWLLVHRLENDLGIRHVGLPQWPYGETLNPDDPVRPDMDGKP